MTKENINWNNILTLISEKYDIKDYFDNTAFIELPGMEGGDLEINYKKTVQSADNHEFNLIIWGQTELGLITLMQRTIKARSELEVIEEIDQLVSELSEETLSLTHIHEAIYELCQNR